MASFFMSLPFKIALRYLSSKRKLNFSNLIVYISMLSVIVSALAMIVVLSAFNGLDDIIKGLYQSFDPDIKITATHSKWINTSQLDTSLFDAIPEIETVSMAIEEVCYIKSGAEDVVCKIKGVDPLFEQTVQIKDKIYDGQYLLSDTSLQTVVLGYGIAHKLGYHITEFPEPIQLYSLKEKGNVSLTNPSSAFKTMKVYPSGIFAINQDFDGVYILSSAHQTRKLLSISPQEISSVELKIKKGHTKSVQKKLKTLLSDQYTIQTRDQINAFVYKTNQTEKWITFAILMFVAIIAMTNLIGAIVMLIIEKEKESDVLRLLGMSNKEVKKIFLYSGLLITLLGSIIGVCLGGCLILVQQHIGLIRLENSIVDFYPVSLKLIDLVSTIIVLCLLGGLSTWFAVKRGIDVQPKMV